MCIRDSGYTVRSFESGDALLEAFRQEPAELVILDIMMPVTDGLTVCRELRAVSDIPIILLLSLIHIFISYPPKCFKALQAGTAP